MNLLEKIASKEAIIGTIGLGYVGLTLLEAFGKVGFKLVGFDIDKERVQSLKDGKSYVSFLSLNDLFDLQAKKRFEPSDDPSILKKADIIIISASTTLDRHHQPNLTSLKKAFQTVYDNLKKDQLIILQSTTYPGTTEDELLPFLNKKKLIVGQDYYLGYVPEVSDPGNFKFSLEDIPKIVSGITSNCLEHIKKLYMSLGCDVIPCSTTKIAEAAKILQNSYRLVNISFINEMKMLFDHMGIDIWEVIDAANTKPFGFEAFYPSPGVGGDCIPVVPNYLVWKAKEFDGNTSILELAEHINNSIPHYVVEKIIQGLNKKEKSINGSKIILLGVAYKKDVNDIRESAGIAILDELRASGADIHYNDPFVKKIDQIAIYPDLHIDSEELNYENLATFDAVIIATDHSCYDWEKVANFSPLIIDTRNALSKIPNISKKVIKA